MKKIGIFYGSTTDTTKEICERIAEKLTDYEVAIADISESDKTDLESYDNLILATSTWGAGDLQDDWDTQLPVLLEADFTDKIVMLVGVGDSYGQPDTFVDGMGTLYENLTDKSCKIVGAISTEGYSFDDSTAVVDDQFVGLAIDEDNEGDMTDERIDNWIEIIKAELV